MRKKLYSILLFSVFIFFVNAQSHSQAEKEALSHYQLVELPTEKLEAQNFERISLPETVKVKDKSSLLLYLASIKPITDEKQRFVVEGSNYVLFIKEND